MQRTAIIHTRSKYGAKEVQELCDYALSLQDLIEEAYGHMSRWNQYMPTAIKMAQVVKRDIDDKI